jgi:hypothetical protein
MPTVRIRTHDPDAVSFFTAKLADCGFDVEFAIPGQRVRGDVDIEITVNYTKKPSAARQGTRSSAPPNRPSQNRVEWTTPYHAEAPDLVDELLTGRVAQNDSKDRELARILAAGPRTGEMFVIGIQEQEVRQVLSTGTEPIEAPRPIPKPTLPIRPLGILPKPKNRHTTARSWAVHRQSFLQRYSAFAAAIILPVAIIIFYLSLFGAPEYAAEKSEHPQPPQTTLTAAPVTQPPQSLALAADVADPPTTSAQSATGVTVMNSQHNSTRRRRTHRRSASAHYEEPEVTVRHFSVTQFQDTAKHRPNNQ